MTEPDAPLRPPILPPADRYGRRDTVRSRRNLMIAGGVLVAALLGFAVWMGVREALKPVRVSAAGFTAVDDGHARLTLYVTMDPGRTAVCTVHMYNSGLTEVGRIDATIGPSTQRRVSTVVTVPTFELATSGTSTACALRD